jgi:hypothetical protein
MYISKVGYCVGWQRRLSLLTTEQNMFEQDFPNHVFSNSAIFLGWWTKPRHLRCYTGVYVYTMQLVQIPVRGGTRRQGQTLEY